MLTQISQEEFNRLLATFSQSAFRLETRAAYKLGYERADFERFLAGSPVPPPELDWWRPWLEQIARLTAEGKQVVRVRIVDEPPTSYQKWEMWATAWHAEAGEQIRYIRRSRAVQAGLPLDYDWWLLDGGRLIVIRYDMDGEIAGKTLTDDPGTVARHCALRDLAVRYATTAGDFAAA